MLKRFFVPTLSLRFVVLLVCCVIASISLPGAGLPAARAVEAPSYGASSSTAAAPQEPGFQETVVFSGLTQPTALQFSPDPNDDRIFVAEKRGVIKVFDSLSDPTPDVFADLNVNVYNFWDRGLLGLALLSMCSTRTTQRLGEPPRAGVRPGFTPIPAPVPPAPLLTVVWSAGGCRA
jgi:hypothetical protein